MVIAAVAGWAIGHWRAGDPPLPDPAPAAIKPWFGPRTATEAIAAADVQIDGHRSIIDSGGRDWLRLEMLGNTLVGRYRLTGSYADLAEGDRVLDEAMALAPAPAGPSLSRAALSATLHRLSDAERALARFDAQAGEPPAPEAATAWALRGDIAMQRGDHAAASDAYARAEGLGGDAGLALRRSMLALRTGDPETARRLVNAVLQAERLPRQAKAMAALQRVTVALAQGDWAAARRWTRFADGFFPDYWLTEAFAAQQEAIDGRVDEAARRYAALAERTQAPEVMDALAHLLRLQGKGGPSRAWAARAGTLWEDRLRLLPEAAASHVIEHELALGDPRRALALAREDARRRPHGATLALLARAQLLTGYAAGALASIGKAEAGGWVSSTLLLQKAEALDAVGRADDADRAREAALALNRRADDPSARFVWFGHD